MSRQYRIVYQRGPCTYWHSAGCAEWSTVSLREESGRKAFVQSDSIPGRLPKTHDRAPGQQTVPSSREYHVYGPVAHQAIGQAGGKIFQVAEDSNGIELGLSDSNVEIVDLLQNMIQADHLSKEGRLSSRLNGIVEAVLAAHA